jgi:arsenate reductase
MAEGFLKSFDSNLEVYSAGTRPEKAINPNSIIVMKELNIDLTEHHAKSIDQFLNEEFDYVITVCDNAKESCPVFFGNVKNRIHIGFEDPADATGTHEDILYEYRRIRDLIHKDFLKFFNENLKK